jgi:type II secretory pathway pseudopilin PulG
MRLPPRNQPRRNPSAIRRRGGAFTLVELIVIIVLLALLSGFAMQKYIDYTAQAKQSADQASINAIKSALSYAFVDHRLNNVGAGSWITTVSGITVAMDPPQLPNGITVVGSQLQDQRGNFYDFIAETAAGPARVQLAAGSPGP